MKILNFGKIKKAINTVKSFFSKKRENITVTKIDSAIYSPNYKRRGSHNWSLFKYKCPCINKGAKKIAPLYRNFSKSKLPGSLIIEGKNIYRIELNPLYK